MLQIRHGQAHDEPIPASTLHARLKLEQPTISVKPDAPAKPPALSDPEKHKPKAPDPQPEFDPATQPPPSSPAATEGLLPARHYFNAKELDQRPRALEAITPQLPEDREGLEIVVLRLLISEHGDIDAVEIVTQGLDEKFGRNAASAFRAAHFSPGLRKGEAVPSSMLVEVIFDPAYIPTGEEMTP